MSCKLNIQLNNDQTIYCPGQLISGSIAIEVTEKCKFSGLRFSINGSAYCKFHDSIDGLFFTSDALFTGHEKFMGGWKYLFGGANRLLRTFMPGIVTFKFSCKLPKHLPSSVRSRNGKISYKIEAILDTEWNFDVYSKLPFTIIRFEDLSAKTELMIPRNDEVITSFCCWNCRTKPLILSVEIPFSGYVNGQNISIKIAIDNRCGFDVSQTIISLKKVFSFTSQKPEHREWIEKKTLVRNTCQGAKSGKITKFKSIAEVPQFTIPTCDLSEVVKISYLLQVKVQVIGFIRRPKVEIENLVIGSLPLIFTDSLN